MKVLQTCLSLSWGGLEMYTLHTAKLLIGAGHQTEILTYNGSRLAAEALKEGIVCRTVSRKPVNLPGIYKMASLFKNNNYDIIHAEASKDLWYVVPALRLALCRAPLLLTKHVGSGISKKDIFHRMLYSRVNMALAISGVIKRNLAETTPLPVEKIELLHDSIDTFRFDPAKTDKNMVRNEFGIKEEELVIGMTGRFSPGKGHEEFLYAANELAKIHPDIRFMIVGEASRGEEEYADSIKKMAYDYGLKDKIIFTGFRKDIPEVLAAMDIYLFPSHAEAFGLALVEAMSMERPTVCSNSDGVLDIAVEGVTSFLFNAGSGEDLFNKTGMLVKDFQKRIDFGKEGRKRVLKMFSAEIFTGRLTALYSKALVNNK